MTDTDKYLAEVRERAEKAAKGPWATEVERHAFDCGSRSVILGHVSQVVARTVWGLSQQLQNGRFIAHARTDIPQLLKLIAGRDAEIARWKSDHSDMEAWGKENLQHAERLRRQLEVSVVALREVKGMAVEPFALMSDFVFCAGKALAELERLEKE